MYLRLEDTVIEVTGSNPDISNPWQGHYKFICKAENKRHCSHAMPLIFDNRNLIRGFFVFLAWSPSKQI